MIAFRERRPDVTTFYFDLARAVNASGLDQPLLDPSRVDVVSPDDPILTYLRAGLSLPVRRPQRLRNDLIDGVFFEDALVYRLAA